VRGYLKKLVIADNVAVYVNKIFMLENPSLLLLSVGSLTFAVQIFADFSAYTDIARASARLLGFDLVENFKSPYLALSPSDFWRRWHISFSSWIRDYLYIPLGGSRVTKKLKFALVLLASLGLSGLWHGASWHFVVWGVYHAALVFGYHQLGFSGRWRPKTLPGVVGAWTVMFCFTIIGWAIFRASSMGWLIGVFGKGFSFGFGGDSLTVSMIVLLSTAFYSLPLLVLAFVERLKLNDRAIGGLVYGMAIVMMIIFFRDVQQDFIYFQF
jgi:alginate O-acetyltransferase complex protein AlgI